MTEPITIQDKNSDNKSTNEEPDTDPANEKTRLTKAMSKSSSNFPKTQRIEDVHSVHGWEIMKMMDFWLFVVTFVFGSAMGNAVSGNIGTYLRSFRLEEHLYIIMTIAPWFYLKTKILGGIISDLLVDKVPRIWFWVFCSISSVIIYAVLFIFGPKCSNDAYHSLPFFCNSRHHLSNLPSTDSRIFWCQALCS